MAPKDWDTIRHQSRNFVEALQAKRREGPIDHPYTYVTAKVTIDGVTFENVGLRKKGFMGSQNTQRPSLKIKLNHEGAERSVAGLTTLTFNNDQQDTGHISQFLGYALFREAGIPAPRCAHARITVNGQLLGVYSHVETVRESMITRAFGNADGTLYEGTVVDFHQGWAASFENKFGPDEAGREKIQQLIEVLTSEGEVTEAAIGEHVDLDSFYKFWAIEGLLGFWDGYSANNNNYFVYLHPQTNRFHFLPWGADCMFEKVSKSDPDPRAPVSVKTKGLVAHKLYQLPEGRQRYADTLARLLEDSFNLISRFLVVFATTSRGIFCVSKPIKDMTRVIEPGFIPVRVKAPSTSATAPIPSCSFTATAAPGSGSPASSTTFPVTVCAIPEK